MGVMGGWEGGTCVLRDTGPRGETEAGLERLSSLSLHAAPWPWHKTVPAHPNTAGPLLPCWISSALNVGPRRISVYLPAQRSWRGSKGGAMSWETLCVWG